MATRFLETLMTYKVTLEHTIDGKLQKTNYCHVGADTSDEAKKIALDIAGSIQGGMFNLFGKGRHQLTIIKVEQE